MAQLGDLIVSGASRFLNTINGTITNAKDSEKLGGQSLTSTYSSTGVAPVTGTAVASAIGALDGTITGSAGAAKTLTAFSQTDGKVSATFGNISITKSQVSDFPSSLPASDTVSTYSATGTAPINGTGVAAALGTLDGTVSGSAGASKTLTAFSQTDGKVSATFGDISITKSQVSDFPTSMTPSSHTHGNIQNGGTLQTTDITIGSGDKLVVTDSSDSNKIARTSASFSAAVSSQTQSTKFLREDGTFAAPSYSDISGKADKSATVSTITWDTTNKKLTKTINGSTTDVVTGATILGGLTSSNVTTALGYTPGTSNLTLGTTYDTAARGNHTHNSISPTNGESGADYKGCTLDYNGLTVGTGSGSALSQPRLKVLPNDITASDFTWDGTNTSLKSAIKDLRGYAQLYSNATTQAQNIVNAWQQLTLTADEQNTELFATQTNGIKVLKAGIYIIIQNGYWTTVPNSTNVKHFQVLKNGTAIGNSCMSRCSTYETQMSFVGASLAANDVITIQAKSEGGTANIGWYQAYIIPLFSV